MKQRELSPVLCDELDVCDGGWLREGGTRGRGCMCIYSPFTPLYSRN